MAILLKCGAVFLHVPKTGGSWVEKVLYDQQLVRCELGDRHLSADGVRYFPRVEKGGAVRSIVWTLREIAKRQYLERMGRFDLRKAYLFCFVRHPLKWYESYFRYNWTQIAESPGADWYDWGNYGKGDPRNFAHPWAMLSGLQSGDFNEFMRGVNRTRPGYVTEMYGWYTNWDVNSRVDFAGKQESLSDDLVAVLKNLNVTFDEDRVRTFQRENVSREPRRPIEWDPDVREETLALEHAGMLRYGYEQASSHNERLAVGAASGGE